MKNERIVVVGSTNTDMVVKARHLPVPGETILGGTFLMNPGGKGANQAVAAARLGGSVTFVAKVGDDVFGRQALEGFKGEGIDTHYIYTDPAQPSGVALITVDEKAENCIVVAPGANAVLNKADIDGAAAEIANAALLLVQLEVPIETVEYVVQKAVEGGVKVILNPAPACALPEGLFKNLYMLTPNETEAALLSGIEVSDLESAKKAAQALHGKGVEIVIVTMGSDGALIYQNGVFETVAAQKVKAVDTTAAGDTFNGALAVALSEGLSVVEAVKFASKAAAISVTRMGAQSSTPYREEII